MGPEYDEIPESDRVYFLRQDALLKFGEWEHKQ